MDADRLDYILEKFDKLRIAVVGDFFLDLYHHIDSSLTEMSLETGKRVHQATRRSPYPGAAGTVTNNLHALGVGRITGVTVIGDDGNGYDLKKQLRNTGVDVSRFYTGEDIMTPTYLKPLVDGEEIERQDIKNRKWMGLELEKMVMACLQDEMKFCNGVIMADQVPERDCGVITTKVRECIQQLATQYQDKPFFVDSRIRIGEFRRVMIKPNEYEAYDALHPRSLANRKVGIPVKQSIAHAERLYRRTKHPVYLTIGEQGVLLYDPVSCSRRAGRMVRGAHIHGIPVKPVDIVGAGDSLTAATVSALCAGASPIEAAQIGVLVSSITVTKHGTGTASPQEVRERLAQYGRVVAPRYF